VKRSSSIRSLASNGVGVLAATDRGVMLALAADKEPRPLAILGPIAGLAAVCSSWRVCTEVALHRFDAAGDSLEVIPLGAKCHPASRSCRRTGRTRLVGLRERLDPLRRSRGERRAAR
jgi:hypothetical protein